MKSFLAGKRGVCPKCGTSLRIPLESQLGAAEAGDDAAGEDLVGEESYPAEASGGINGGSIAAAPAAKSIAAPSPKAAAVRSAEVASTKEEDPIADAPSAIWYVRPPGGEQYGPARGDIMRRWIAEGRVSNESLVWREGWTDWQNAAEVFPSLAPAAPVPPPPPSPEPVAVAPRVDAAAKEETATPQPRSARLVNRYEARKKQGSGLGLAAVILLGLLCVVLAVLLAYVFLMTNNGGNETPKAESRAVHGAAQRAG